MGLERDLREIILGEEAIQDGRVQFNKKLQTMQSKVCSWKK